MAEEMLKLTTMRKRRQVEIDVNRYDVLDLDELPLGEALAVQDLTKALGQASKALTEPGGDGPSPEIAELGARMRKTVERFMPSMPAEVRNKLTDTQCLRLVTYFFERPTAQATPAAPEPVTA